MHILEVANAVAGLTLVMDLAAGVEHALRGKLLHFQRGIRVAEHAHLVGAGDLYAVALCDLLGQGKVLQ